MRGIIEILKNEPNRWFSVQEITELRGVARTNIYTKMKSLLRRGEVERRYTVNRRTGAYMQVYRISNTSLGKSKRVVYRCIVRVELVSAIESDLERQDGSTIPLLSHHTLIDSSVECFGRGYDQGKCQKKYESVAKRIYDMQQEEDEIE